MNRLKILCTSALVAITTFIHGASGMQAGAATATGDKTKTSSSKANTVAAPSTQDISDAKTKGLVWVNLNTHVYHKDGSASYGTTKHGKFMAEADATKAGYRAAKEPVAKKTATK